MYNYSEPIRKAVFAVVIRPRWGRGVMGEALPPGFATLNPGLPQLSRVAALLRARCQVDMS
jgi:hypothetical protein